METLHEFSNVEHISFLFDLNIGSRLIPKRGVWVYDTMRPLRRYLDEIASHLRDVLAWVRARDAGIRHLVHIAISNNARAVSATTILWNYLLWHDFFFHVLPRATQIDLVNWIFASLVSLSCHCPSSKDIFSSCLRWLNVSKHEINDRHRLRF